ncbi:MAG: NAD-dependent epimerase/dehydratase family protein [Gammaproteobacteria bacterium]
MTRVLVSGATGFVGTVLCETLVRSGYIVRAAVRTEGPASAFIAEQCQIGDIGETTDWSGALVDVDYVVHLAARVHMLRDVAANSRLYHETNVLGTQQLVRSAVKAGVRRFVHLSSVKVNGEQTTMRPYAASDEPHPADAYGVSKCLSEAAVREASAGTSLEAAIVRPPLVYGPGVRANFLRLMKWVAEEWPLPLGRVENQRSLVSVWNLCALLEELLRNPNAPGQAWMVSDGEDVSTPELIRRLATAMGRRARLLPVPVVALRLAGLLTGRTAEVSRLCGSLVVDSATTCERLGWLPPTSMDEALARTARWYLSGHA